MSHSDFEKCDINGLLRDLKSDYQNKWKLSWFAPTNQGPALLTQKYFELKRFGRKPVCDWMMFSHRDKVILCDIYLTISKN